MDNKSYSPYAIAEQAIKDLGLDDDMQSKVRGRVVLAINEKLDYEYRRFTNVVTDWIKELNGKTASAAKLGDYSGAAKYSERSMGMIQVQRLFNKIFQRNVDQADVN